MANNEILKFCETDTGTNLLSQMEYEADSQREIGNQPGIARSKFVNKVLKQTSLLSAGLAQFLADNQIDDITDELTEAEIAGYLESVVGALGVPVAVAGGTADAITADFAPDLSLDNGRAVIVRAGLANTSVTPTFSPDGTAAKTIVKGNGIALVAGDIAGAGHWLLLSLDTTLNKWILGNPAHGVATVDLTTAQTVAGEKTFTDLLTAEAGMFVNITARDADIYSTYPDGWSAMPIDDELTGYPTSMALALTYVGRRGSFQRVAQFIIDKVGDGFWFRTRNSDDTAWEDFQQLATADMFKTINSTSLLGSGDISMEDWFTSYGQSIASNGYQKLPSGLIIQWGRFMASPGGSGYVNSLPIAFPNAPLIAVGNHRGTDATVNIIVVGITTTTVTYESDFPSANVNVDGIVIGY